LTLFIAAGSLAGMSTKLAKFITRRMGELDLSFADIAAKCRCSEMAVRNWASGDSRPADWRLGPLARILKVKKADLDSE
jgi:ribosome-binding protein aMBF1 (putative translation factor)